MTRPGPPCSAVTPIYGSGDTACLWRAWQEQARSTRNPARCQDPWRGTLHSTRALTGTTRMPSSVARGRSAAKVYRASAHAFRSLSLAGRGNTKTPRRGGLRLDACLGNSATDARHGMTQRCDANHPLHPLISCGLQEPVLDQTGHEGKGGTWPALPPVPFATMRAFSGCVVFRSEPITQQRQSPPAPCRAAPPSVLPVLRIDRALCREPSGGHLRRRGPEGSLPLGGPQP